MSDEQREILQMVSDGKITADDGAKLLEALKKGEQRRKETESPARRMREKRRLIHTKMKNGPVMGLEGLRDIKRMVRGIISDSIPVMDEDDREGIDEDMFEDIDLLDGSIDLDENTILILKQNVADNNKGDLVLNGIPGSKLEVLSDDHSEIRIAKDNDRVLVKWYEGDLELNVPETVESLRASLLGGDILLNAVPAETDIRSKGGDIRLSEASGAFRAKTMGGDIIITLTDNWTDDSKATAMGGDISLEITAKTRAEITAKTMGGKISVQDDIQGVTESGHPGASRVNIDLSDDEDAPQLRAKTMGGNISVTLSDDKGVEKKSKKQKKK